MPRACYQPKAVGEMAGVPVKVQNEGQAKAASGIAGFDGITNGGLPEGRTTLLVGGPGSGKTIFGVQFLRHGAAGRGLTRCLRLPLFRVLATGSCCFWYSCLPVC